MSGERVPPSGGLTSCWLPLGVETEQVRCRGIGLGTLRLIQVPFAIIKQRLTSKGTFGETQCHLIHASRWNPELSALPGRSALAKLVKNNKRSVHDE